MAAVGALGAVTGVPMLIAPFGSTCMMIFGAPDAPFARPRNVLGGHLICTATGLVALRGLGSNFWIIACAVGVSMALMGLTRTFHPPAGGDTVLVMMTDPGWTFLFVPVLLGCVILLAVALPFHHVRRRRSGTAMAPVAPVAARPDVAFAPDP